MLWVRMVHPEQLQMRLVGMFFSVEVVFGCDFKIAALIAWRYIGDGQYFGNIARAIGIIPE